MKKCGKEGQSSLPRSSVSVMQKLLYVQIFYIQSIVLDKLTPRLDLIAHQDGEDAVGFDGVFDADLEHCAFFGVHVVSQSCSGFISPRPL